MYKFRIQHVSPPYSSHKCKKHKLDDQDVEEGGGGLSLPELLGGGMDTDVYTRQNHIYFKTDVNSDSIDKLCRNIDELIIKMSRIEKKSEYGVFTSHPIYLHITTNGGSLLDSFIAYDKIKSSTIPIYTIIEGYVASAGSIMSIAGASRYMTANSHLLIHQLRSFAVGTFENILDDKKNCVSFMKKMVNMYHVESRGKMSKTQIRTVLKRDIFWNYVESLDHGLIDGVWPIAA